MIDKNKNLTTLANLSVNTVFVAKCGAMVWLLTQGQQRTPEGVKDLEVD